MIIGLLKERERRVALIPENVEALIKLKTNIIVEKDAGVGAFITDGDYIKAGAMVETREKLLEKSQLLLMINPPEITELEKLRDNKILVGVFSPFFNIDFVKKTAELNLTSFSLDVIPRTSRAQAMDILSSMATVAGYKAVLTAANLLNKFFPMFMTAAGTITPAKVMIIGAGVAGLQALAISRKLGAIVEVFDVRAAVKEEVMGLGGKFIEVEGAVEDKTAGGYAVEQSDEFKIRQAETIQNHAVKSDVIICTAQIPGKNAPVLIKKSTVEAMKPGSVIVDIAASTGGNCELTKNNQTILHNGVTIIGNSLLAEDMPTDASKMFGKNLVNFLKLIISKDGELDLNWNDDIVKGTVVTHNREIVHEKVKSFIK